MLHTRCSPPCSTKPNFSPTGGTHISTCYDYKRVLPPLHTDRTPLTANGYVVWRFQALRVAALFARYLSTATTKLTPLLASGIALYCTVLSSPPDKYEGMPCSTANHVEAGVSTWKHACKRLKIAATGSTRFTMPFTDCSSTIPSPPGGLLLVLIGKLIEKITNF